MGLRGWWQANRQRAKLTRQSVALNSDQELIRQQVPELFGMSDVEGMAYVMHQIREWNKTCSDDQTATFADRLAASNKSFQADGLTMPYWGNLWVLRTYQRQLGLDVPAVAEAKADPFEQGQALGQDAMAALDLFIEVQVVPRRKAFLEVFKGQLERLDERRVEMDGTGKTTRAQLARLDFEILRENWRERRGEQIAEASTWLDGHLRQAEGIDCISDFRDAIEQALSRQGAILVSDGLSMLLGVHVD